MKKRTKKEKARALARAQELRRTYYARNLEKSRAYRRKRYASKKEKLSAYAREYRKRPAVQKYQREYQKTRYHTEKGRAYHLKRKYGITQADYEAMLVAQGGGCATCGTTDPGRAFEAFSVDHDHATDAVRGLLCHSCNMALGLLKDDPTILRKAAEYLERHKVS